MTWCWRALKPQIYIQQSTIFTDNWKATKLEPQKEIISRIVLSSWIVDYCLWAFITFKKLTLFQSYFAHFKECLRKNLSKQSEGNKNSNLSQVTVYCEWRCLWCPSCFSQENLKNNWESTELWYKWKVQGKNALSPKCRIFLILIPLGS